MRVKGGVVTRRRHKKMLKLSEGFRGKRGNCFKHSKLGVHKALQYAYRDRKAKKRVMRSLWIVRINAAVREAGMSYSSFISAIRKVPGFAEINRKALAEMAFSTPTEFGKLVESVKAAA